MIFSIGDVFDHVNGTLSIKVTRVDKHKLKVLVLRGYKKGCKRLIPKNLIDGIGNFWFKKDELT